MATAPAREEKQSSSRDNSYGGGGGGFGKFKKKPYRKSHQATPYTRPSTAIRNPNNGSRGWLSKIVDPAQRLLTAGAHRFFNSVFRKRLTAPATPPLIEPERDHEARDNEQKPVFSNPNGLQGGPTSGPDKPSTSFDHRGLTDLEQILRQKTFSRSEIEHLTTLLHSRTVDLPMENGEKRSEVIPMKQMTTHDGTVEFPKTTAKENGVGSHFASSPATSLIVLDEDIASPAELAKSYMGTVSSSKVSPSMLGLRGQALMENAPVLSSRPNLSKSPIKALAPRSSGYAENGFVTPRSRGRSVIYGMARTPYARVQTPASVKGAGPATDVPSSSRSVWEHNRLSESRQGALKCRNSFLDNEIGSVGPIRRIRQKSNLLPGKNLSSAVSGAPLFTHEAGIGSDRPSSSVVKPLSLGESKHSLTRASVENGVKSSGTSFIPAPSKTSEMATRILEQLDKLVSPKEKSPHKIQENIVSSHVLENALGDSKKDGVLSTLFPDARDGMFQKSKLEENGPRLSRDPYGKTASVVNGVHTTDLSKDILPAARITDPAYTRPQKWPFMMNAHEDYLVFDDEVRPNGVTPAPLAEGREKTESVSTEKKSITFEATMNKKPLVRTTVETSSISVLNKKPVHIPTAETANAGKTVSFAFPGATIQPTQSNAFPLNFANEDAVTSSKGVKCSSGFASVSSGATDSVPGVTESDKSEIPKNTLLFRTSESTLPSGVSASSSAAGIFSILNNGSIASTSSFSTAPPPVSNNAVNGGSNSAVNFSEKVANTNSGLSSSAALPFVTASPIFKFASSMVPSTPAPLLSAASDAEPTETKTKDTGFSNLTSNPFDGTSSVIPNTGGSVFGTGSSIFNATSSAITSTCGSSLSAAASSTMATTGSSILGSMSSNNTSNVFDGTSNTGSNPFSGTTTAASSSSRASIFAFSSTPSATVKSQGTANGAGFPSSTSTSAPSFVVAGSAPFSSASPFGPSSSTTNMFSSGSSFEPSSINPSTMASSITSNAKAGSGLFGPSTAPNLFGPTVGASSSSVFSFTAATSSQLAFNNISPFSFSAGNTNTNNNDQMSIEDGMAEDTVQGPTTVPVFVGQQPMTTPTSFMFGLTAPLGGNPSNPFASTTPSGGANPFQFVGQPNSNPNPAPSGANPFQFNGGQSNSNPNPNPAPSGANPFQFNGGQSNSNPNPSPFQASGSVEFNAGGTGSFSLGSGAGDKCGRKIVKINRNKNRRK